MPLNVLPGGDSPRYGLACPRAECREEIDLAIEPEDLVFCTVHSEPMVPNEEMS